MYVGLIVGMALHALNLNLVLVQPRLGKIIIELHPKPYFGTAAKSL